MMDKLGAIAMIALILAGALVLGGLAMLAPPVGPWWPRALTLVLAGSVFAIALWDQLERLRRGTGRDSTRHVNDQ